ncbi:MAG: flavin reductase family protein [Rhodobacteraceae bacterium]|nr:flavin reductase family protein [Paracoccaceae bacterium]
MTETAFTPGPATERALRTALGRFATGITVVTCQGPAGPLGLTANSFAAVSLDPALVLWSPARASRRHDAFVAAGHYAIHVLGEDQHALCRAFVRPEGWFPDLGHSLSPEGVPLLPGCLARFECARTATYPAGDHTIVVGRVLRACYREGAPLIFSGGLYGRFAGI